MKTNINITESAKEIIKVYKEHFAEEMSFEMYLEIECSTSAPFEEDVNQLGGLSALEAECKKIDPSLF